LKPERSIDPEYFSMLVADTRKGYLDAETLRNQDDADRRLIISKGYGPDGFRVPDPDAFAKTISRIVDVHFHSGGGLMQSDIQAAVSEHLSALGLKVVKANLRSRQHPNQIGPLAQTLDGRWSKAMGTLFSTILNGLGPVRAIRSSEFVEQVNTFSFESQDAVTNLAMSITSRFMHYGHPLRPGFVSHPQTVLINAARFAAIESSLKSTYSMNPFEPLLRLYEKGYWPFGVVGALFSKSFVVFSSSE
jgi:hypothetical protein